MLIAVRTRVACEAYRRIIDDLSYVRYFSDVHASVYGFRKFGTRKVASRNPVDGVYTSRVSVTNGIVLGTTVLLAKA